MNSQYQPGGEESPVTQELSATEEASFSFEQTEERENMPHEMNMPYGQSMPYGMNVPYGSNMPYGMNVPYGSNMPYGMNVPYGPNMPYGMNVPYGQNMPYGMNGFYGVNMPYGIHAPHGMYLPYGMNMPYGMSMPNGMNVPYGIYPMYGMNALYGMGMPYGQNPPQGMNAPYGQNPPQGMNASYGQNPPQGVNVPYGQNPPQGMNAPYGQNPPQGMNAPYGQNLPQEANAPYGLNTPQETDAPYGLNTPSEENQPYGMGAPYGMDMPHGQGTFQEPGLPYKGAVLRELPSVYSADQGQQGTVGSPYQGLYQIAPNHPGHTRKTGKGIRKKMLLLGLAGVIAVSIIAITIGIVINDDGKGIRMPEALLTWTETISPEDGNGEAPAAISFPTQSAGTIRGEMFAVGEDGNVFLRTEYGVCRVGENGNGYEYNGWAAELDAGIEVSSMAVYGDFLYLACGKDGIYRVNTVRSNTVSQIIDAYVTSFVIAEDSLFYISMNRADSEYGELYIAGLNGKGSRSLGEKVRCALKYQGSADFVYVDGYLYYLDKEDNLKRMRADGTRGRVVVERDRQKPSFESCGLYENDGILYLPSRGGCIYSYDIEADKLKKVTNAWPAIDAPILFAGDALLYYPVQDGGESVWHQIMDGKDTVYESPLNDGTLWMQAVGTEKLFSFHGQNGYYDVSFLSGEIRSEELIVMDYDTMPEVSIEDAGAGGLFVGDTQTNCRASHLAYTSPDGSYTIFTRKSPYEYNYDYDYDSNSGLGLVWVYTDGNGEEHTTLLVEDTVRQFCVMDGMLYYTTWYDDTESMALFRKELAEDAEAELLLEGWTLSELSCCNGKLYYLKGHKLYCYDPESGEEDQIGDDQIDCYDILNDTVYYQNLSYLSVSLYKMRLDGTEAEEIVDITQYGESLSKLTAFWYRDSVYFAAVIESGDLDDPKLWLFAEDGSTAILVDEVTSRFDQRQNLYYRDGCLYYSAEVAFKVRVLNLDEYFDGGGGIRAGAYDTVFCEENMNTFEVTDQFVYVQMYTDPETIKVFDRLTGELVDRIDCEDFADL